MPILNNKRKQVYNFDEGKYLKNSLTFSIETDIKNKIMKYDVDAIEKDMPRVIINHTALTDPDDAWVDYDDDVYCFSLPEEDLGVIIIRRNSHPVLISQSRSGQKSTLGALLTTNDLFTTSKG